jgi:hypothetical protein
VSVSDHSQRTQETRVRRGKRRRANGEGSIWLRKDGRYGYAAYALTTAGTYKRVQGYAKTYEDADRAGCPDVHHPDQAGVPVLQAWLGCSAGQGALLRARAVL